MSQRIFAPSTVRPLAFPGLLVAALSATSMATAETIGIADDQIARLGIELGRPEAVAAVPVATAPAEVVIPFTQQAVVSAPVSGFIAALHVAAGEPVTTGQPLAEIRSAEFMDLQRRYLDALAADDLARAQLERDEGLFADGVIASRRLQETTAMARAATLARAQADQELHIAGLDSGAIATLSSSRELSPTLTLRAPRDGYVIAQHTHVGASLESLAPVLQVADLRRLWLEVHLPQEAAARVDETMRISATPNGVALSGTIVNIGQVVDPDTQTVLIRGVISNDQARLRAGQFLTVDIVAPAEIQPALAVPSTAMTRVGTDTFVFVRTAAGFDAMQVTLLSDNGERAYVDGSLETDTEIAIGGISALKAIWLAQQDEAG